MSKGMGIFWMFFCVLWYLSRIAFLKVEREKTAPFNWRCSV